MKAFVSSMVSVAVFAASTGCGGETAKPVAANEAAFKGTSDDDKSKVAEYLKKANIEGEIVGLISGKDAWQVDVGIKAVPGKRGGGAPPKTYTVNKTTGEVKKEM